MLPSFKRVGDKSQKGSHNTLRIPIPARKNIEAAKYPKAGRKKAKDPKKDRCLRSVMKPTTIKTITTPRQA